MVEVSNALKLQVKGQESEQAPPALFANFLGISRVGGDVQFEFLFADLNQLALLMTGSKPDAPPVELTAKTVSKIVMPAENVIQLKEHVLKIFSEIEKEMKAFSEIQNVTRRASS